MSREVTVVCLTRLYREVRTRAVEDGWVEPYELDRPYPYRLEAGMEYRLEFSDGGEERGHLERGDLDFIQHEEKGAVLISVEGRLVPLAPDYRVVTDARVVA